MDIYVYDAILKVHAFVDDVWCVTEFEAGVDQVPY
jgi:hypothetical protein